MSDETPPTRGELATRKRDPLLRWFATGHLREDLRPIVEAYTTLAHAVVSQCDPSAERTLALRSLIESKDNAVRALVETKGKAE